MPRVLLGVFGAVARLGLRELLEEEGFEVVSEEHSPQRILPRLKEDSLDVVILDLDSEESLELADRIAALSPSINVIACSSERSTMRIFPPFHDGESYLTELSKTELVAAVRR